MVEAANAANPRVIVGLDGSNGSRIALQWAAERTDRFGSIQTVSTWRTPWWAGAPPAIGVPLPPSPDIFENLVRERAEEAISSIPGGEIAAPIVERGHPGQRLCHHAADRDLLVVGSRGRGAIVETVAGSTSSYCASHSTAPVAIIPESTNPTRPSDSIVVGIDGSELAIAALVWAIDQAPTGARIEAIQAFMPSAPALELAETYAELSEQKAQNDLDRSVERALGVTTRPRTEYSLTARVALADPREALARSGPDLIVVGARGHRGVTHLLLGSVATSLSHGTPAPTIIVPG